MGFFHPYKIHLHTRCYAHPRSSVQSPKGVSKPRPGHLMTSRTRKSSYTLPAALWRAVGARPTPPPHPGRSTASSFMVVSSGRRSRPRRLGRSRLERCPGAAALLLLRDGDTRPPPRGALLPAGLVGEHPERRDLDGRDALGVDHGAGRLESVEESCKSHAKARKK